MLTVAVEVHVATARLLAVLTSEVGIPLYRVDLKVGVSLKHFLEVLVGTVLMEMTPTILPRIVVPLANYGIVVNRFGIGMIRVIQ
jgi:hypothetical protein